MSNVIEYKDCYVAFVDVLGFKNIIQNGSCEEIYSIFEDLSITGRMRFMYNEDEVIALNDVRYMIMSDSIVMYIESSITDSLFALLYKCQRLQKELLDRSIPIFLRGGISKGELFVDEEKHIIFGKALTSAYLMENGLAKYPRIIFNKELLDTNTQQNITFASSEWKSLVIEKDEDELYFVSYIGAILVVNNDKHFIDYLDSILSYCQKQLDSSHDPSIREKYLWVKKMILRCYKPNSLAIERFCGNCDEFNKKWEIKLHE